jgi:dimethylglycine dehydrogenase
VNRDVADQTGGFEVELIGERRPAVRLPQPAYDPDGRRMRA